MAVCEVCGARISRHLLPDEFFDPAQRAVLTTAGEPVPISPTQWRLLQILWERRGTISHRELLMSLLYDGNDDPPFHEVLNVHIHHLRRALKDTAFTIEGVWGQGWRLVSADGAPSLRGTSSSGRGASYGPHGELAR